jgi:hypothetical protein
LKQRIYDIQIKSLRAAVEHMALIDLTELAQCVERHGTADDRALIAAVQAMLAGLEQCGTHR